LTQKKNSSILEVGKGTAALLKPSKQEISLQAASRVLLAGRAGHKAKSVGSIPITSTALGINASVYQKKGAWFVEFQGVEHTFYDGIALTWEIK